MRRLLYAVAVSAAGGVILLLAAGRTWGSLTAAAPGQARQHVSVTGQALAGSLPALGLALLALSVAALAGNGWMRRIAGAFIVLVGASAVPAALHAHSDVRHALVAKLFGVSAGTAQVHEAPWWLVAVVAGVLAAASGVAIAINGNRWAGMGRRYDAPVPPEERPAGPDDAWSALDRGEDPTSGDR